jgi:membrane protein
MTGHRTRTGLARRMQHRVGALKKRYSGSVAENVTNRLVAIDVLNRGLMFAGVLLLCLVPFLIVLDALEGRSEAASLARHLGLNQQASADLSHLFTSSSSTASAVTGVGYVLFIVCGIAAVAGLQDLYRRAFNLTGRGMKDVPYQLVCLVVLAAVLAVAGWAGPPLRSSAGPVVLAAVGLVTATIVWWFAMWVLLAGRIPWRELFPAAVATGLFWVGMDTFFALTFSGWVTSDQEKYGSIGVVFALMSFLIAVGVVVLLGAVVGSVWRERHPSHTAPATRVLRRNATRENLQEKVPGS